MIEQISLHGQITDQIEYFATVTGADIAHRYFYETTPQNTIRLFSGGNEFSLEKEGISYKGNGGSFCEYMFGVNLPLKDMMKNEVRNRLVIFGALYLPPQETLRLTDQTSGSETYHEIFHTGNAISNYYFFVHLPQPAPLKEQQELLLRAIGKTVKRSTFVGQERDTAIVRELFQALAEPKAILFLIRLGHQGNRDFYRAYRAAYLDKKAIHRPELAKLEEVAKKHGISKYHQERVRIDVIYKHPDNKRLIDEYRTLLVEFSSNPSITQNQLAKLNRLRTLSARNNIPTELLASLDELFLKGKQIEKLEEPTYLTTAREILEGIFLSQKTQFGLSKEDLTTLLRIKQQALENKDFGFEGLLLDLGRSCDEHCRAKGDVKLLERFGVLVTFFDRFDATYAYLNQITFMEDVEITEKMLRTIYNNKRLFDEIHPKLFKEIFIDKMLKDRYLTEYGRRKIFILFQGLKEVENRTRSLPEVARQLLEINQDAGIYRTVAGYLRKRMQAFYREITSGKEVEVLRKEVSAELLSRGMIQEEAPQPLFERIARDLQSQAVYFYEILPKLVNTPDNPLREQFLKESGLDLYDVEELEREYFESHGLSRDVLTTIQRMAA